MTTNPFTNFKEIINSHQDPNTNIKSTWYHPKSDSGNSNNGLCLQCNSPRKNPNFYPFCGAICKGAWNAARVEYVKRNDKKNPLLEFSEVLDNEISKR